MSTLGKYLARSAVAAGILIGAASQSSASVITFNDVVSGGPQGTLVTGIFSFQHDLNDNLSIGAESILTAKLSIVLSDPNRGNEQVDINLDGTGFIGLVTNVNNGGNAETHDTLLSLLQISSLLQNDGLLNVILRVAPQGGSDTADVMFVSSTLSGTAENTIGAVATAVPEPASLGLLGSGLLGLGALRRRRKAV